VTIAAGDLTLEEHGAVRHDRAALSFLPDLRALADTMPQEQAGVRLYGAAGLTRWTGPDGVLGRIAAATLGTGSRPVRAILFDKTAGRNWSLAWHQDRTIAVRERIETPGFGPWTIKAGVPHVAPPMALLAGMLTMRVHLDDVSEDNARSSCHPARPAWAGSRRIISATSSGGSASSRARREPVTYGAMQRRSSMRPLRRPVRGGGAFFRSTLPRRNCRAASNGWGFERMITRNLRITGRVQNVFYRDWFVEQAQGLGVTGWVRNRADGSVEAVVSGSSEMIEAIVARAHQGSPPSRVEDVVVSEAPEEVFDRFEKRATV